MAQMTITKGGGGWSAETKVWLGMTRPDTRGDLQVVLVISTRKASQGGIYTAANVHAEGHGIVTFDVAGDFSKTIERDRSARCTEKSIREAHMRAMLQLDAVEAEAKAFYVKKAAEAA